MERPTDELVREHRLIEVGLAVLDRLADLAAAGAPDVARLERALRFLIGFADQLHHGKEEEHLFPLLERRGMGRHDGPTAVIFDEHEEGRRLLGVVRSSLRALREGQGGEAQRLAQAARAYSALLREHIEREDEAVFPLGESLLTPGDAEELVRGFAAVERDGLGPGFVRALEEDLRALAGEVLGEVPAAGRR